jgi:hypothetical protein
MEMILHFIGSISLVQKQYSDATKKSTTLDFFLDASVANFISGEANSSVYGNMILSENIISH